MAILQSGYTDASRTNSSSRSTRLYRDVALSFERNAATKDVIVKKDVDAVKQSVKNLLLTIKGERYMQPRFGTRIREILFDNNTQDVRDLLRQTLNEDIRYWLPYINIQNVELVSSVDMHAIAIRVFFQVTTVGSEMVINIMASENEFVVTDAEPAGTALVDVGTVGQGSAFDLGAAATGFAGGGGGY